MFNFKIHTDTSVLQAIKTLPEYSDKVGSGDVVQQGIVMELQPHGGFLLEPLSDDAYCVHTLFLPNTPLAVIKEAAKLLPLTCFMDMRIRFLRSSVCSSNKQAGILRKMIGGRELFSSPSRIAKDATETFYELSVDDWIVKNKELQEMGHAFHSLLGEDITHGEDAVHDCYAGALMAFAAATDPEYACNIYNEWAKLAGYARVVFDEGEQVFIILNMKIYVDCNMTIKEIVCQ